MRFGDPRGLFCIDCAIEHMDSEDLISELLSQTRLLKLRTHPAGTSIGLSIPSQSSSLHLPLSKQAQPSRSPPPSP